MAKVLIGAFSSESHSHESEEQLEMYAMDRLSGTDLIRVEEHLIVCEHCRLQLEETDARARAFREVLRLHPEPDQMAFSWFASSRAIRAQFQNLTSGWGGSAPRFAMASACITLLAATGAYMGVLYFGSGARSSANLLPVASLQLTAMRGEMGSVPAARELNLTLTDAPAEGNGFRLDVVNANGETVWSGAPERRAGTLAASVRKLLDPGVYFVRLRNPAGQMLHEYGLLITR